MRRLLTGIAFSLLVLSAGLIGANADSTTDPQAQQALIDQIRAQLGSNLADAMAAQQQVVSFLGGQDSPDPNPLVGSPFAPGMNLFEPYSKISPGVSTECLNYFLPPPH